MPPLSQAFRSEMFRSLLGVSLSERHGQAAAHSLVDLVTGDEGAGSEAGCQIGRRPESLAASRTPLRPLSA